MKKTLISRQIYELVHFTHVNNLESILLHGLMPVSELDKKDYEYYYNDEYRHDKCTDAVCTSIEFPNYKMFTHLHINDPNWVVIKLSASVVLDFDCAFCITNAGSAASFDIPLSNRRGKNAFLKLFDEVHPYFSREQMHIPPYYPTDPQAEVLVFGTIPTSYINSIAFKNIYVLNNNRSIIPNYIKTNVDSSIFMWRSDYQYWKKQGE